MKKKILLFILSLIMIVSTVSFLGCVMTPPDNGDNSANNNDADTGDDDIDYSDEYGTVTIDDIFVLINGTKEIVPVFSMPREAEDLTYTFSGSAITITDGIIKGVLLNSETTVTATSEHFKTTFKVTVVEQIFAINEIDPLIAGYYYPLTVEFENVSRNDDITDLEFNFGVSSSYFSVENGNLKATQDTPVGYYTFRAKLGKFITKFSVRVGDKSEIGLGTHGTYTTRYNIVKDRVNYNIDVLFAGD
ncbi:MAG: hypothetical protein J6V68_00115 [Clostridia bacterium]|nr:hypothetical protein [Clostridia bacterium]